MIIYSQTSMNINVLEAKSYHEVTSPVPSTLFYVLTVELINEATFIPALQVSFSMSCFISGYRKQWA